jgi:predicted ArsR family transcriptional regulator
MIRALMSIREKILHTLLSSPGLLIKDLAIIMGINGISIRNHQISLESVNSSFRPKRNMVWEGRALFIPSPLKESKNSQSNICI